MTSNLIIASQQAGIGKTTFSIALARTYKQDGKNVGYFKPITDREEDTDSLNAKKILNMDEDVKTICPVMITTYEYDMDEEQLDEINKEIQSAYDKLIAKYDFLIIETCNAVNHLAFLELSALELAKIFNAKILLIASGRMVDDMDSFIMMAKFIRAEDVEVIGGVMTIVPAEYLEYFKTSICPILADKHNIPMFGIVPDRSDLVAPTVAEIASSINGKVIAGKKHLNKLVENYMVGAMNPETALKYFRSSVNKAVITGGDRPQLAIAALETDTSVLILTGSIMPPASVIAKAEERHIPILLVGGDTFSTIKTLTRESSYGRLRIEQEDKIKAWDKVLAGVKYTKIFNALS